MSALSSTNIKSFMVNNYKKDVSTLAGQFHLPIIWVSSHWNFVGNEMADELGDSQDKSEAVLIPCPLRRTKIEIYT